MRAVGSIIFWIFCSVLDGLLVSFSQETGGVIYYHPSVSSSHFPVSNIPPRDELSIPRCSFITKTDMASAVDS